MNEPEITNPYCEAKTSFERKINKCLDKFKELRWNKYKVINFPTVHYQHKRKKIKLTYLLTI